MVRGPREPNPPTLGLFHGIPKVDMLPLQKVITVTQKMCLFSSQQYEQHCKLILQKCWNEEQTTVEVFKSPYFFIVMRRM